MTGSLTVGIGTAIAASVVYGAAPVIQAVAAARTPGAAGIGLRLTLRLAHRPLWLAGLGCEVGGFVLEAFAFTAAPATVVAPVLSCEMVVFVLLCWSAFGSRPSVRIFGAAAAMGGGIALLVLAFSGRAELGRLAGDAQLIGLVCGAVVVAGIAAFTGARLLDAGRRRWAAGTFSVAAGISYGVATLSTRQVGRTFTVDRPWQLLVTPTPYVLAVCSVIGIALMQRGLQVSPVLAFPVVSSCSALLPVVVGTTLLHEAVPGGLHRLVFALALALLVTGVGVLGADRSSRMSASGAEPATEQGDRG